MPISRRLSSILLPIGSIAILTLLAYLPAMRGGFIWDDPDYVVNNLTLRTLSGLRQIWFEPRSLPQYYPLVHTTFWIEYQLWGLHPAGYHITNILLHAANAVLLGLLLRRLAVPGAWLAAAIFALHPVHVESVAWITERKNVLSGIFYLLAGMVYLGGSGIRGRGSEMRFLPTPDPRSPTPLYLLSLLFFLLALLSKTVTATLPAAILLVIWWKHGRIRWRDGVPLIPFFILGLCLAMVTATMEARHVGAIGPEWNFSFLDRCLIAGRAAWFYAGKLIWPYPLVFIYPKWAIDPTLWWQYLFPAVAVTVVILLWLLRRRIGRGPAAGVLFFGGTLLPALGFINIYPMRYSFVADHFQYLASIGLIALFASGVRQMIARWHKPGGPLAALTPAAILLPLFALTFRQTLHYRDSETLWRAAARHNPFWMVYNNLGQALLDQNRLPAAADEFRRAIQVAPELPQAHYSLGYVFAKQGNQQEAMRLFDRAIAVDSAFAEAYHGRGEILLSQGRLAEAAQQFQQAVELQPNFVDARFKLDLIAQQREGRN